MSEHGKTFQQLRYTLLQDFVTKLQQKLDERSGTSEDESVIRAVLLVSIAVGDAWAEIEGEALSNG